MWRLFLFSMAVSLFFAHPFSAQASNRVNVQGNTITVEAQYRVEPANTKLSQRLQSALDNFYNQKTFLYKCYYVKFNLTVDTSKYGNGDENVIKIVETSNDPAVSKAYHDYGMYTYNDWGAYEAANGTHVAAECSSFFGGEYNLTCAQQAQWFFDSGLRTPGLVTLGYSTGFYPPGYNGVGMQNGSIYVSDEATEQVLAHEVGHNLGFRHPFDAETTQAPYPSNTDSGLMYPFAGDGFSEIFFDDLHEMLDNMNLECQWDLSLSDCKISGSFKNAATASTVSESARVNFTIESHDLSLKGDGKKTIDGFSFVSNNGVWTCIDPGYSNGTFKITGSIESAPFNNFKQAFNLKVRKGSVGSSGEFVNCYTQTPFYFNNPLTFSLLEWGLSAGSTTSSYAIVNSGRSFDNFNLQFGDPSDLKKILNGPLDFDKTDFMPGSDLVLETTDLTVTDVRHLKRAENDPD